MPSFRELFLSIFLLLFAANPAWPQGIRRIPRKPPELPKFNLSGTLDRLDGRRIVLTTEAGYTWILQPKRNLQVELTGKAKPAFLAPGQFIAFLAKLDTKRGTTVEKVARLTVFLPDKRRQPGILPDLGFGDLEKETLTKRQGSLTETLGNNPSAARSELSAASGSAPGGKKGRSAAAKVSTANIESFVIHGKIISIKKGRLLVQVPENMFVKPSLKVEVAEDANIDVELSGVSALAFVRPGDHIQARGDQIGEGMGYANILTFRLAQPLGTPPLPKKPPPKTKRPAQKNPSPSKEKTKPPSTLKENKT